MSSDYNFQQDLENAILKADSSKIDRRELLTDIFKNYVARLFEHVLSNKSKNRIELDAMVQVKRNLINEFTKASLGEYQKTTEQYEDLFETCVQEIFNEAALNHAGDDMVSVSQRLEIDPLAYIREGGLFVPQHLRKG